ncbi:MAG: GtrA family protein [Polaromonas sp.]|nr:GtrA family protein [Polaromonas sp.]
MASAGVSRFVRFSLVGVVGFVVDAGLVQVLVSMAGWGPLWARAVALPAAVFATFLLNRHVTFSGSRGSALWPALLRYAAVSAGGASVNFLVYSALVLGFSVADAWLVLPLAVASGLALAVNYLGSKHFAFRQ